LLPDEEKMEPLSVHIPFSNDLESGVTNVIKKDLEKEKEKEKEKYQEKSEIIEEKPVKEGKLNKKKIK
jgi:hypothetical protein